MELQKIEGGRVVVSLTAEDCITLAEIIKAAGPRLGEDLNRYSAAMTYSTALEGLALAIAAIWNLSPKEVDHYRAELGDLGISELIPDLYPTS